MSLVGTLGKVALGIVVAKGVGKVMGGGGAGGLGGLLGGQGGGGLGGLLGGAAGGGGLGSLLGGAMGGQQQGGQQQQGGGLGGLLGGAGGGAAGGLGGLLGGATQGGAGGLGGLLDSLGGGAGGGAGGAAGGLGGLLNGALQGQQPPAPTQQQEETAKILITAMVNAAKSDGQIDEQEQQKIVANLGEEVSEEERNFVLGEMQAPLDIEGFIASVPRGAEQQVYLMSLMAIDLDSQAEAQYLDKLREAFGMTQEASNAIHAQVGVPPLYG